MEWLTEVFQIVGVCVLIFNSYQSWRNGRIARHAVAKIDIVEKKVEVVVSKTIEIVKVVKNGSH